MVALLDVGCGAGSFAAACKERFGCEACGVEIVPEMAKIAESRLDRVFNQDALEAFAQIPEDKFDLITFTDVLEHLVEPAEALRACARLLAKDGVVLASLPNIRYWHAFSRILFDKDFPYEDSGIFDRTHLRFFTRKSIPRLFEAAGYEVVSLTGINPSPGRKFRLLNAVLFNALDDCRYLQYVIVARPKQ